jgi:hypothetical protein
MLGTFELFCCICVFIPTTVLNGQVLFAIFAIGIMFPCRFHKAREEYSGRNRCPNFLFFAGETSERINFNVRPKKNICVFTVTCQKNLGSVGINFFFFFFYYLPQFLLATLFIFTQNLDNHFCCLTSSNVLFIQLLAFCRN